MKTKKKITSVFLTMLTVWLLISLAACGNSKVPSADSSSKSENQSSSSSTDRNGAENSKTQGKNKSLIVYFSRWGNTDYPDTVDASTSASIVIDGERSGTTEYVARLIQKTVGGDIHLIETATPYTRDFDELRDVNHDEMSNNTLPELKESNLDIAKYDTVFVGYPVWATDVPQAVVSFLNQYNLSGKTVIPFCTHDGYGAGNSYRTISDASKAEKMLNGLAIEAKDVPNAKDTVTSWLESIGIAKQESDTAQNGQTAIKITIGDIDLDGVLYDTALAQEIKGQFPLTLSMSGYGGREYYGGVNFYPKNLKVVKRILKMAILPIAMRIIIWRSFMHKPIIRTSLWRSFQLVRLHRI